MNVFYIRIHTCNDTNEMILLTKQIENNKRFVKNMKIIRF